MNLPRTLRHKLSISVFVMGVLFLVAACGGESATSAPTPEPELSVNDLLSSAGEKLAAMSTAKFKMIDEEESGAKFFGNTLNRQDPCCPRPGARRLPEGAVGRLHHGRLTGTRADRGQGRAATAQPSEEAGPAQAAHRRRAGLRPTLQDRRRTPLRGLQPTLRERVGPGHHQPALRRVDRGLRLREAHRSPPGPPHSPCSHPGDERRELPSQAEPAGGRRALSRRSP